MDAEDQARAQAQGAAFLTSVGGALQLQSRVESASFQRPELKYDEMRNANFNFRFQLPVAPLQVGFLEAGGNMTRATIKEYLYGKTVNGRVWVQANKSMKEVGTWKRAPPRVCS